MLSAVRGNRLTTKRRPGCRSLGSSRSNTEAQPQRLRSCKASVSRSRRKSGPPRGVADWQPLRSALAKSRRHAPLWPGVAERPCGTEVAVFCPERMMSHAHTAPHNRSVAIALLAVAALSACRQCEDLEEEAQDVEPHHSRGSSTAAPLPPVAGDVGPPPVRCGWRS